MRRYNNGEALEVDEDCLGDGLPRGDYLDEADSPEKKTCAEESSCFLVHCCALLVLLLYEYMYSTTRILHLHVKSILTISSKHSSTR